MRRAVRVVAAGLAVAGSYEVKLDFPGAMGGKGIDVAGTGDHHQRFDLAAPGPDPPTG